MHGGKQKSVHSSNPPPSVKEVSYGPCDIPKSAQVLCWGLGWCNLEVRIVTLESYKHSPDNLFNMGLRLRGLPHPTPTPWIVCQSMLHGWVVPRIQPPGVMAYLMFLWAPMLSWPLSLNKRGWPQYLNCGDNLAWWSGTIKLKDLLCSYTWGSSVYLGYTLL